jgi:MazG family protein
MSSIDELLSVVARLRAPDGCAWDRAQTASSMSRYAIEEAFEVAEAIDSGDRRALVGELGDLLFIVALIARIAEDEGSFCFDDVAGAASAKMIARHPHVFGDAAPDSGGIASWEARKAERETGRASLLDGVPRALPALLRAERIGAKASAIGFDWADAAGPRAKLDEEIAELDAAIASGDEARITDELGDVLFTVANLSRHLPGPGAEAALRGASAKFERRFTGVELRLRASGLPRHAVGGAQLERWWAEAKAEEGE